MQFYRALTVQVANSQHVGVHVNPVVLDLVHHLAVNHLLLDGLGVDNAKLVRVAIRQALDDCIRLAVNQNISHVGLPKVVGCVTFLGLYADKFLNGMTHANLHTVLGATHNVEV